MSKRSGRQLTSPDQREREAEERDHKRKMLLLDRVLIVLRVLVFAVPILVGLWFLVLLIHAIAIGDWQAYEEYGKTFVRLAIPYAVGLLTKFGLLDRAA